MSLVEIQQNSLNGLLKSCSSSKIGCASKIGWHVSTSYEELDKGTDIYTTKWRKVNKQSRQNSNKVMTKLMNTQMLCSWVPYYKLDYQ